MTKAKIRRLIKEIAVLQEAAYRRGFQHGHYFATPGDGDPRTPATREEVSRWRFAKGKGVSLHPPGSSFAGGKMSLAGRLECELSFLPTIREMIDHAKLPTAL